MAAAGYGLAWMAGQAGDRAPLVLSGAVILPVVLLIVTVHPTLAVAAVFLLVPLGVRSVVGPLSPVHVAIVLAAGLVVLTHRTGAVRPGFPAPLWWLVALLGWVVLAIPAALDRSMAIRQAAVLTFALIFLLVVVAVCTRHDDIRRVLPAVLGLAVLGTITSAFGAKAEGAYGGSVVNGRAPGFFDEPNSFGTLCMIAALVALALALGGARGYWRALAGAATVIVFTGLVLSFSRGAWIGFSLGLIVLAATLPQVRRALGVGAVVAVSLAVGLGAVIPQPPQIEVAADRLRSIVGEKSPYDDRPRIWAEARREIVARPLFGYGPGNFPEGSRRSTYEGGTVSAYHAHNFLLTWGAEAGLPAVAILVALSVHVGCVSRRARRSAARHGRRRDAALLAGLSAALLGVAGQGLVDYTLGVGNSVMFLAVAGVLGLLLASVRAEEAAQAATTRQHAFMPVSEG